LFFGDLMGAVSKQMTFTVVLQTHSARAHRRLARALKTALRRDQLRAVDIYEQTTEPDNQRKGNEQPRAAASAQNRSDDQ
jgi:hypothetical protein